MVQSATPEGSVSESRRLDKSTDTTPLAYVVESLTPVSYTHLQAYMWGNSRLGYWRVAYSPILKMAIINDSLRKTGYVTRMGSYLEWHPK